MLLARSARWLVEQVPDRRHAGDVVAVECPHAGRCSLGQVHSTVAAVQDCHRLNARQANVATATAPDGCFKLALESLGLGFGQSEGVWLDGSTRPLSVVTRHVVWSPVMCPSQPLSSRT